MKARSLSTRLVCSTVVTLVLVGCGEEATPLRMEPPTQSVTLVCPTIGKIFVTKGSFDIQIETANGIEEYPRGLQITKRYYIVPYDSTYWFTERKQIEIDRITLVFNYRGTPGTNPSPPGQTPRKCELIESARL